MSEFDLDVKEDPEILDDEEEGLGGDQHYDNQAVETVQYDHSAFELPDDYEPEDEDDDFDDSDDDTDDSAVEGDEDE